MHFFSPYRIAIDSVPRTQRTQTAGKISVLKRCIQNTPEFYSKNFKFISFFYSKT